MMIDEAALRGGYHLADLVRQAAEAGDARAVQRLAQKSRLSRHDEDLLVDLALSDWRTRRENSSRNGLPLAVQASRDHYWSVGCHVMVGLAQNKRFRESTRIAILHEAVVDKKATPGQTSVPTVHFLLWLVSKGWTPPPDLQGMAVDTVPNSVQFLTQHQGFTWPGSARVASYRQTFAGMQHLEKMRDTVDTDAWDALEPAWERSLDDLVEACNLV